MYKIYKFRLPAQQHGFTRIAPGSFLAFSPDAKKTVYISVFTVSGRHVSTNKPVRENRSVKVNENGYLQDVKYGKIWETA